MMVRTSQRLSSSNASHKRIGSESAAGNDVVKKSRVARQEAVSDQDAPTTSEDGDLSDFEDATSSSESGPSEDDDEYDSRDDRPRSSKRSVSSRRVSTKITPLKHTANGSGIIPTLRPGETLIVDIPRARSAGKIPYEDHTLHPNTFLFLGDLKQNNERQWLKMHDADFRQAERDWFSFVDKLTERIVEVDETIPELPIKDVIYRIYRDVRFSPDPTPYKTYFSVAFSRTGRKSNGYAGYYVQISPEDTFVGGGLWHPEAASLTALRRAIDRNSRQIKDILLKESVRKEFLKGAPKNDAKVVKAFADTNAEYALKTKPKGYDADHADIELLRLRNYTIGRKLSQDEIVGGGGLDRVTELLACLRPFVTYLNSVVKPDEMASESEEEDSDGNDGAEDDNDSE